MPKDVDFIRDNGGKVEHNDLSRPSRDDRKNPFSEDNIQKEDRKDYKDTTFDPDMRVSRVALRIAIKSEFGITFIREEVYRRWKEKFWNVLDNDIKNLLPKKLTNSGWCCHHFGEKKVLDFSKSKNGVGTKYNKYIHLLDVYDKNPSTQNMQNLSQAEKDFLKEMEEICFVPIWFHNTYKKELNKLNTMKQVYDLYLSAIEDNEGGNERDWQAEYNSIQLEKIVRELERISSILRSYRAKFFVGIAQEVDKIISNVRKQIDSNNLLGDVL